MAESKRRIAGTVNSRKTSHAGFLKKAFEYDRRTCCLRHMRKTLLPWTAGLGTAISLVFSSCTYDPYYSSAGGYYGDGYGYGSSSFSTSLFVTTGDPRWGYDPYTYCYYDYRSRRYYDPYLYGYYPVGYRPYAVYGVPHPYGWRPGHGHCPPPRTVRNVTVVNYRDRESAYRNTNYSWARQVRHADSSYRQPSGSHRPYSGRQTDYRTRQTFDRNSPPSSTWSPRETNRTREYTPDSHSSRDRYQRNDFQPTGNFSRPPSGGTYPRQETREFRPEATRVQSTPRPQPSRQLEIPRENRSRGSEQPRGKAPSSNSSDKKTDSWNSKRQGLRSLGDA